MAFYTLDGRIGASPVGTIDTTARHQLGDRILAVDSVYGSGEFIYLKGVASTVVGSLVIYEAGGGAPTFQTTLGPSTANSGQQYAVATAAVLANQFGWYQVSGVGIVATNGTLAGVGVVYAIAGGTVTSAATAGKAVNNMRALTATGTPAANQAVAQFMYPFAEAVVT